MSCALAFSEYGPTDGSPSNDVTPVLFASSIGSSRVMWSHQVEEVSAQRRMIAFDYRGHGSSPTPDGPYEIADLGGDVLALMDSLGIERADFVGLSLGGTTGYAINPARDLGPRIAHALLPIAGKGSSDWGYAWIPVAGPVIGGLIGALTYRTFWV